MKAGLVLSRFEALWADVYVVGVLAAIRAILTARVAAVTEVLR